MDITQQIKDKNFPADPLIPLDKPFVDHRGMIQNLITDGIESVAVITSVKGSVRSNHYHKYNSHYLYVLNGKIRYHERNLDGSDVKVSDYVAGQMFFTPPDKVHKVEFLEDTVLISLAPQSNAPDDHDNDTVHQEF
ncbi:MAG TPA: cupin domain-containing protein [Anaerovoracaceae bacterium]|nr:cupin domain-containing protein [Anaerovoracaceae bacterium]